MFLNATMMTLATTMTGTMKKESMSQRRTTVILVMRSTKRINYRHLKTVQKRTVGKMMMSYARDFSLTSSAQVQQQQKKLLLGPQDQKH